MIGLARQDACHAFPQLIALMSLSSLITYLKLRTCWTGFATLVSVKRYTAAQLVFMAAAGLVR